MDGQTDRQPASQPVTVLLMVILDDRMASGFSSFPCLCLLISPQQSQRLFSKDELEVLCKINYVSVIGKNKLLSAGSAFASDLEKISLKLCFSILSLRWASPQLPLNTQFGLSSCLRSCLSSLSSVLFQSRRGTNQIHHSHL